MPLFKSPLDLISQELLKFRTNLFYYNNSKSVCKGEETIVNNMVSIFLDNNFETNENIGDENRSCYKNYNGILDLLIYCVCSDCTLCEDKYAYLAQRERLCCILKNLKKLLCQIKCFSNVKCELFAQLLCLLLSIIESIISIVLDLISIESLCDACLKCKKEIFECLLCNLIKNINEFEDLVNELACLVLEIASQNIINCTTCTTYVPNPKHKDKCKSHCHPCKCEWDYDCHKYNNNW